MAKKTFYTVTEAARVLKLGRAGIHAAIKSGRLHAEMTTLIQVVKKRAYVISAKELNRFKSKVDRAQQKRGKKTLPWG